MTFKELAARYSRTKEQMQASLESAWEQSEQCDDDAAWFLTARFPALSYGDALTLLSEGVAHH